MTVILVPYDATWPTVFEEIAAELREHGDASWAVEHIGSTAIPGMSAKPIIDVAVRVTDADDFETNRPGLEAAGWRRGSGVRSHRVMIFEENGIRTRIAHFFEADAWAEANQRILRDWLRQHPEDATLYESAKYAALDAARMGEESYNGGKTAVVQHIVDRARAARGLASVSVFDKE